MEGNRYFQEALSKFTHEAASAGAIRHLADRGYTAAQIMERLDFPTPYERVRQTMWEHLTATGMILREEPGRSGSGEHVTYVRESDGYGRPTFRRVVEERETLTVECFREQIFAYGEGACAGQLLFLLREKAEKNGEAFSYASCDFGLTAGKAPGQYEQILHALEGQREYVAGLPWERRRVYHRLTPRFLEILALLCGAGRYQGVCFFLKSREKVVVQL